MRLNKNDRVACNFYKACEFYKALEKIREIAFKKEYLSLFECLDDILDIANKALGEVENDRN